MDTLLLIVLTLWAVYYLYKQIFSSGGCDCGSGGSCKNNKENNKSQ